MNAEELEVVPGFERDDLQGKVWEARSEEELREGIEKAFGYRGDVTIHLKDETSVEGYIFDRRDTCVRLIPRGQSAKLSIPHSMIKGISFTGRDTAAGKSWEAWVRKYQEKKSAGETNVELVPEKLD